MPTPTRDFSVAVFPFLKTKESLSLGGLLFRSTDDTTGLPAEQILAVQEIASMLFLQDSLRIKSATFAITPYVDLRYRSVDANDLIDIQSVIAYFYASPRHTFGDLFLSPEHASMAIFSPGQIFTSLVRPDFHVEAEEPTVALETDKRDEVRGYSGLYNFCHPFWVTKGSRLFGPLPRMTLNQSQDLSRDLGSQSSRPDYVLLRELLTRGETETGARALNAVRWFNAANSDANDDATAILKLAIAFESLLNLPADEKTDRLTDSISLLLGRTPRLDIWARQFYGARSRIVHEGRAHQLRFIATDARKAPDGPLYQTLLSYGRQVFQLCLGTLLTGAALAERAGLAETLVTNEERFQRICKLLADEKVPALERLDQILPIVAAVEQYRYVPETDLKVATMIGATRLAAKTALAADADVPAEFRAAVEGLISARAPINHLEELEAIAALKKLLDHNRRPGLIEVTESLVRLIDVVYSYSMMHYYWLKEQSKKSPPSGTPPAAS